MESLIESIGIAFQRQSDITSCTLELKESNEALFHCLERKAGQRLSYLFSDLFHAIDKLVQSDDRI